MHPIWYLCKAIQTNSYEISNGSYHPTVQHPTEKNTMVCEYVVWVYCFCIMYDVYMYVNIPLNSVFVVIWKKNLLVLLFEWTFEL